MNNSCFEQDQKLHQQFESTSPKAVSNLTPAEHDIARKLATDADIIHLHKPLAEGSNLITAQTKAQNEMSSLIGQVKDPARLDGILADANTLLSKDDMKLLKNDQGVMLGAKGQDGQYYLADAITGDFSCKDSHFETLMHDRYARERELEELYDPERK